MSGYDLASELADAATDVVNTVFGQPGATHDPVYGLTESQQLEAIRASAERLRALISDTRKSDEG